MKDTDILYAFFATLTARELSINQILALASPIGITETNVRSALSRMHARNMIAVRKHGRAAFYRMGIRGARIGSNVSLHFREPDWSSWKGAFWIAAFSLPDSRTRHQVQKKLLAYRFRALYPGMWIRPLREEEGIPEVFKDLLRPGEFDLFHGTFAGEISGRRIAEVFGLRKTAKEIQKTLQDARRSCRTVSTLSPEAAFVQWLRLGDRIVKTLIQDPMLPPAFWPAAWPAPELRREFKRWNTLYAERSAPFAQKIVNPSTRGE
jgi:DNA-binding transcriptional regulator PaaX